MKTRSSLKGDDAVVIEEGHDISCPYVYGVANSGWMMAASVDKTLVVQGLQSTEQVGAAFAEVRAQAEADLRGVSNEKQFEEFKNHWLGRKSGVVTKITDNWLKQAPTDLKKLVGQEFNKFKTALEALIEERRAAIETWAEEAASTKDRVGLSLPGGVR